MSASSTMSGNIYPRADNKGAYAQLEQSLVAPEEDLPTTSATVSSSNKRDFDHHV